MNGKFRIFIDIIGLGWLAIASSVFCVVTFGYSFGMEVKGIDNPFLFLTVFVLTVWGFYSLSQLNKYINKSKLQ